MSARRSGAPRTHAPGPAPPTQSTQSSGVESHSRLSSQLTAPSRFGILREETNRAGINANRRLYSRPPGPPPLFPQAKLRLSNNRESPLCATLGLGSGSDKCQFACGPHSMDPCHVRCDGEAKTAKECVGRIVLRDNKAKRRPTVLPVPVQQCSLCATCARHHQQGSMAPGSAWPAAVP
jgi:hypothetical protein